MGRVLGRWLPLPVGSSGDGETLAREESAGPRPPIDRDMLVDLFGGTDREIIAPVLESFEASFGEAVRLLDDARAREDCVALKRAAHLAIGSTSSVGADGLTETLKSIEALALTEDWERIDALRADVTGKAAAVLAFLEAMTEG